MHSSFIHSRTVVRMLLVSMLACAATACSDDFPEPPRNLDGAVFVPPILDGGAKGLDASVTLGIDASLNDASLNTGDAAANAR